MQTTFDPVLVARILERPGAEDVAKAYVPYTWTEEVAKAYVPYTWELSKGGCCLICDEPGYKNPSEIIPGLHKREWFCAKHIRLKIDIRVEVSNGKPIEKVVDRLRDKHFTDLREARRRAALTFEERCAEGQRKRRLREALENKNDALSWWRPRVAQGRNSEGTDPVLVARILERPGAEDLDYAYPSAKALAEAYRPRPLVYAAYLNSEDFARNYALHTWDLSQAGRCVICDEPGFKNPSEIIPGSHKREWLCAKHIQRKLDLLVEVLDGKPLAKVVDIFRKAHRKERREARRWASLSFAERCQESKRRNKRRRKKSR